MPGKMEWTPSPWREERVSSVRGTWRSYEVPHGLPGGVSCLSKDQIGCLWLGTPYGLARFDGQEFETHSPGHGPAADDVLAMLWEGPGRLWIGTRGGLFLFEDGKFTPHVPRGGWMDPEIRALTFDQRSTLWIGTSDGLYARNGSGFHRWGCEHGLPTTEIEALCCPADGALLVGTGKGLVRLEGDRFREIELEQGAEPAPISALHVDRENRLWVATRPSGLLREEAQWTFSRVALPKALEGRRITRFAEDEQGALWVATWGGGIGYRGRRDGTFRPIATRDGALNDLAADLLVDEEGQLWIAHPNDGVSCHDAWTVERLTDEPVGGAMTRDGAGRVWFVRERELACLEADRLRVRDLGAKLGKFAFGPDGALWIGTEDAGLLHFPAGADVWGSEPRRMTTDEGLPSDCAPIVWAGADGEVWAGCGGPGKLCRVAGGEVVSYELPLERVGAVARAAEGGFWIGCETGGGLVRWKDGVATVLEVPGGGRRHCIQTILETPKGRLWVGTLNGLGLLENGEWRFFDVESGVAGRHFVVSALDAKGFEWFGTMQGGAYLSDGRHLQWMTRQDGLPANSVTGLVPEEDGAILIGTKRGIIRYRPRRTPPRQVMIRSVVNGQSHSNPSHLRLTEPQARHLRLHLGAISLQSGRLLYCHRISGLEEKWSLTWNHEIRCPSLPPGEYHFQAYALSRDLTASETMASLRISVEAGPAQQEPTEYLRRIERMERRLQHQERFNLYNRVLVDLGRLKDELDLERFAQRVTETSVKTLNVSRAAVWLSLDPTMKEVTCLDFYGGDPPLHVSGGKPQRRELYRRYYEVVDRERVVVAPKVAGEARYSEFGTDYFLNHRIRSRMDAGIRAKGRVIGALVIEHQDHVRDWAVEEQTFAAGLSDLMTLAFEAHQRAQLEAQIQQTQKLESLGVLAGGIAHDFNNLLVGMLGYAGLARMSLPVESPAQESLQQIEIAARRAADLTKQLLAYSGKGRFVVQPLDLNRVILEMRSLLEVSVPKSTSLRFNFAHKLPTIMGDVNQLHQVVINLVMNGAESTGELRPAVVTISTGLIHADQNYLRSTYLCAEASEGDYVYLEVCDNGAGMDPEMCIKIFDPFFSTKFTGRGLGLPAVLGIVRSHKGAIKVYSEPARGTTVKVLFPRQELPVRAIDGGLEDTASRRAIQAGEVGGPISTILVVDDEPMVRKLAQTALERAGHRVLVATDGREALKCFREQAGKIDLVLLDLSMPGMDGEETFRELRRIDEHVRVVLTSGYNEQESTERFSGKRLAGYVQKPYLPRTLVELVGRALAGEH